MAHIAMTYIVMAYVGMAYIVMAAARRHGLVAHQVYDGRSEKVMADILVMTH